MPKRPHNPKTDIILTGFAARGPHSNVDAGESESDLDLNSDGGASFSSVYRILWMLTMS